MKTLALLLSLVAYAIIATKANYSNEIQAISEPCEPIDSITLSAAIETLNFCGSNNYDSVFNQFDKLIDQAMTCKLYTLEIKALCYKADWMAYIRELSAADSLLTKIIQNPRFTQNSFNQALAYTQKVEVKSMLGEADSGFIYISLANAFNSVHVNLRARNNYNCGQLYLDGGNLDSAYKYFNLSLTDYTTLNLYDNIVGTTVKLATIDQYQHKQIEAETKLIFCDSLIKFRDDIYDITKSNFYTTFGDFYRSKSDYENATKYYSLSLTIYEAENDDWGIAITNQRIANMLLDIDNNEDALKYGRAAYETADKSKLNALTPSMAFTLANCFKAVAIYDSSIHYYDICLATEKYNKDVIAIAHASKGLAEVRSGNKIAAAKSIDSALITMPSNMGRKSKLVLYQHVSNVYNKLEAFAIADSFATICVALSEKSKNKVDLIKSLHLKYLINVNEGNYKLANELLVRKDKLEDSINLVKMSADIESLNIRYQTAIKDNQIKTLEFENALRMKNEGIAKLEAGEAIKQATIYRLRSDSIASAKELSDQQLVIKTEEARSKEDSIQIEKLKVKAAEHDAKISRQKKQQSIITLLGIILLLALTSGFIIFYINTRKKRQLNSLNSRFTSSLIGSHFVARNVALNETEIVANPDRAVKRNRLLERIINDYYSFASKDSIPVSIELLIVKNFLEIEQLRLPNRFDYEIKIFPEDIPLNTFKIAPPLIIQTLAENAIKHGVESCIYKVKITIELHVFDGFIQVGISDNGPGWSEGVTLETILNRERTGAIKLIHDRLAFDFGKRKKGNYLALTNLTPCGASIQVKIPYC